ncbi:MAG: amino acid ABC transporter ATP-binding protein [Limnochordia bacterium]|jgi:polar amino acid transport system ATP-binding protein|nr:amino acid ABC transporter ATP-binding protein [Bacillota bacterium]NLL07555.1 amino acid ABC transporter ATP-binding protein [Bacillota bacterium]HBG09620.1 peptide ABC transporter ATP-binding protein [Bacillota bacterium]
MLQIRDLHKSYGKAAALAGVDLDVAKGETVVIMGPSGCGKSTLIRCVNRLTEPDSGSIILGGQDVLALTGPELQQFRRKVGFVFQHFNLIARLTVLDNVMFHLVLAGMDRDQARERALAALDKVGLKAAAERKPGQLSGGQQQRVGIARALAAHPEIMLWDEPTASLDPILVGEVLEVMEELVKHSGTTMVIVTHEVSFALRAAHRIVFMDRGKVVEEGEPERVFAQPRSEIAALYKKLLMN